MLADVAAVTVLDVPAPQLVQSAAESCSVAEVPASERYVPAEQLVQPSVPVVDL